jgi:glycosyltransferase involved in cell wall biosynthesis/Flp pilus assembly protein TadD
MTLSRPFRLAIFDQIVSAGGVRRFTLAMVDRWLAQNKPTDLQLTLFWPSMDSAGQALSLPYMYLPPHLTVRQIPRGLPLSRGLVWLSEQSSEFDLIYCPSTVQMLSPDQQIRLAAPVVVTLHDLAHEFTEAWGPLTLAVKLETRYWAHFAQAIIFSSDYIRNEAICLYHIPPEKTYRVYLAPPLVEASMPEPTRVAALRSRYRLPLQFVLSPGTAMVHKNPLTVIEAFGWLKQQGYNLPLVLIGPLVENLIPGMQTTATTPYHRMVQRRIQELGLEIGRDLFILGHVPDAEIPVFYAASSLVVTATRSEAGLSGPVFEAMWYQRPVVCSAIPQFIERLGTDEHLVYMFDPNDPYDLAQAIRRWADDPAGAEHRVAEAYAWVSQRSWDDVAREYLEIFQSIARSHPTHAVRRESHLVEIPAAPPAKREDTRQSPFPRPSICWVAPIFDFSGYARLSRDVLRSLGRREILLAIQSLTADQEFFNTQITPSEAQFWQQLLRQRVERGICVCFHPPTLWEGSDIFALLRQHNPGFDAYVGITMFETDRLPTGWAAACNGMDEIWVPSTFNRETFARAGVDPDRLQVIPFGLDTRAYDPDQVIRMKIPGRRSFAFLSVFQWNKRKGWDILLRAYLSAFKPDDDVCLILRTYPDRIKTPSIQERIDHFVWQLGYDPERIPPIILLEKFVAEKEMPALYAAADAFVLPTRGEGWGLPFMEAMAMGLPVIATRWSAHLDFINDDNGYLIDIEGLEPISPDQTAENPFYTPDQKWAKPSVEHTASLMRHVYEHRDEARAKGVRAHQDIQSQWHSDRTADWIIERAVYLTKGAKRQSIVRELLPGSLHSSTPTPVLLWHAPIFDPSGYADEARYFILHLQARGIKIAARAIGRHSSTFRNQLDPATLQALDQVLTQNVSSPFINLIHFPAYAFTRLPGAAYHIGRVMFETDGLPAEWVAKCNQMDEIWVPTDFNMQTFRNAGVTTKLFKVPGGIDTERFRPGYDPLPIPGARGIVFLSIFEWSYRKGWDVLLRAWAKAFSHTDDVSLVLRTHPINATDITDVKQEIERRITRFLQEELGLSRNDVAPIIVLGEQVPEGDLPRLFAAANAYVAPSRGEGWGRPHMQAMACGLPVIATRWGGNLEFMNDENSLLIDIEGLVEIDERAEIPFYRGQRWAEPCVDHLVTLLRWVVERPEEMTKIGQRAREDMVQHWQWEKIITIAVERLHTLAAELIQSKPQSKSHAVERFTIRWEGSQFVYHSLALINRELCLRLIEAGHEVSIIPYEPDQFGPEADPRFHQLAARIRARLSRPADVHVRHQWPPNFTPPSEGHWVIFQHWEFGSLPKRWVEVMSTQVDEVWVLSSYVRDCYIRSGVPADRIFVIPGGVDTARFRPDAPPLQLQTKKRFKFLFVGGTIARKGIDILLDAYVNSFSAEDDVCLVIKDMGGQSFYKGQTAQKLIARYQGMPGAPEIEYIDRTLSDDELVGLYTACDCLVHPYRGEGFGLPIAEAMASGLPVIVTGYGAALDFCNEETAYLIPAQEVRLPQKRIDDWETVDYPWWAEPDREELKRLMRHIVANPAEARAKGQAARAHIQANFTWERAAAIVQKRVETLRHQPIRRFAVRSDLTVTQEAMTQILAAGQAALERGDLEVAAREFAQVTQRYPDLAAGHTALGSTLMALGRPQEAIPALRRAAELIPQAAPLQNQLGVALYQAGDLAGAETAFQTARQADPNDVQAALNLIDLYRITGDYAQATAIVKDALRLHPDDTEVLAAFGTLCAELGDGEGVEMALRRIQARDPHHPAIVSLQQALLASDESGEAVETLPDAKEPATGEAQVQTPVDQPPQNTNTQQGLIFLAQGNLAEAEKAFCQAVEKEPQSADALCNLAELLRTQGRYDEASTLFLKALRIDPNNAGAILGMATLSSDLGDTESALFFYRQARIRYPELAEFLDPLLEPGMNSSDGTHVGFTVPR